MRGHQHCLCQKQGCHKIRQPDWFYGHWLIDIMLLQLIDGSIIKSITLLGGSVSARITIVIYIRAAVILTPLFSFFVSSPLPPSVRPLGTLQCIHTDPPPLPPPLSVLSIIVVGTGLGPPPPSTYSKAVYKISRATSAEGEGSSERFLYCCVLCVQCGLLPKKV